MDSLKGKLSNWLEGFQKYINSFTVVEKQNKIFYFSKFSVVLSEFHEIYNFVTNLKIKIFESLIEQFKYCVKEIISFMDKNLSEKEKVIHLYSSCLLIYYKKFCFETNNTFEEYYDNDFINISTNIFKYQIINHELFKIFLLYCYSEIKKQIIALDYTTVKNLKKFYSYSVKEKVGQSSYDNTGFDHSSNNNDYFPDPNKILNKNNYGKDSINEDGSNKNSGQENSGLQEQVLTYLVSAKERMVDLIFEIGYKGYFPIFNNDINVRFQRFYNMSAQNINLEKDDKDHNLGVNDFPQKPKCLNANKNSINSINKNIRINPDNSINEENQSESSNNNSFYNFGNFSPENPKNEIKTNINYNKNNDKIKNRNEIELTNKDNTINNSFYSTDISSCCDFESLYNYYLNNNTPPVDNNINNYNNKNKKNKYTKRIITELSKYEVDDKIIKIIEEVAEKIDKNYIDKALNTPNKSITIINNFSCYIVEFGPEMLQNVEPKYKDILQDYCIKFIVLAKELYNAAMELFTTIYDLSYTNIHTFIDLSKSCGIQIQYAETVYSMFKVYSELLLKENQNNFHIKSMLKKLFKNQRAHWDEAINKKAKALTTFYKVQKI